MGHGKGNAAALLRASGYSYKELAELFGQPESSVRRLVAEAKDKGAGKASSWPSHLIIPDTQCKQGVSLEHLYWAGRYAAEKRPDVIVHVGDHWDYPSLSSYESRASRYFEGKRYLEDVQAGNLGLELFEKGLDGWQPKRKVMLRGNHEDRVSRALNEDPRLEGVIGFHLHNDVALGWEVHDFLRPVEIDGTTFSHYFPQPLSGRPYSGAIETRIRNIGFGFIQGHEQGYRFGRLERGNGAVHQGMVAGSFYSHDEEYKGIQGNHHWRGIILNHEVRGGDYDEMRVSLDYLRRRFG